MKKSPLSLNNQHDYITLKTPNGNFTVSWGGYKASGKIQSVFNSLVKYVETERKSRNLGEVMESLTNPSILSSIWPEWNSPVEPNLFLPTNKIMFTEPLFLKKYPNGGVVKMVKRKTVYVLLTDTNQIIGFDYQTMKKV